MFYSVAPATQLASAIGSFAEGHAVVGVCGTPYKCTPAPSECALLLHDALVTRGVRETCEISYITPQRSPVPPAPDAAAAVLEAFAHRGIRFVADRRIVSLDRDRSRAGLDDGTEVPCDLFLGVPKHRAGGGDRLRHDGRRPRPGGWRNARDALPRRVRGR